MAQSSPLSPLPLNAKVRLRCRLSDVALSSLDDLANQHRLSRTATVNKLVPEWVSIYRFVVPNDEAATFKSAQERQPYLNFQQLDKLVDRSLYKRHPTALYPTIDNVVLLAEWAEQLPTLSYGGSHLPTARAALALEIILRGWVTEIEDE